ncbi:MAG: right-handed parallel beta-helix repeat-containing protein, partial [Acidobacteriota bacterium]
MSCDWQAVNHDGERVLECGTGRDTGGNDEADARRRARRCSLAALWASCAWLAFAAALPARGETFLVTDTIDAIPAPEGSLRWAIESSERNGEPDHIVFVIDGGTIALVAPLPDLREGVLRIGSAPEPGLGGESFAQPSASQAIVIDGGGEIERAIAILSERNVIGELQFVGFRGEEVVLIAGERAQDNTIFRCVFGDDASAVANAGAAIRIRPEPTGLGGPSRSEIVLSRLVGNGAGVIVEAALASSVEPSSAAVIRRNWFGTDPFGGPGGGTGRAIDADGPVVIEANRFSGPGVGIRLGVAAGRSRVSDNEIGLVGTDAELCIGFDGPAVRVDARAVELRDNIIQCSETGILLAPTAREATIVDNQIGGEPPRGHRSHGVLIDGAHESLIERNTISGNEGYGITIGPASTTDPASGHLISCNAVWRNSTGAIFLPGVATAPAVLTLASAVHVEGEIPDLAPGWAELFGDESTQARVFQGAVRLDDADPPLKQQIPVLDLVVRPASTGSRISFDTSAPAQHTATRTDEARRESASLSDPLPAVIEGLVFDVIRGDVDSLAPLPGGGIDLGDVICLRAGIDPDVVISPDIIDPERPAPGGSFFYLARRRDVMDRYHVIPFPASTISPDGVLRVQVQNL